MPKVSIPLNELEPIGQLLQNNVNLLMEIETNNYTNSDGVNIRDTEDYKRSTELIGKLHMEACRNETN